MPRPRADPTEAKLKRRQRNQRYNAKPIVKEHVKSRNRLHQQNKRDQARQLSLDKGLSDELSSHTRRGFDRAFPNELESNRNVSVNGEPIAESELDGNSRLTGGLRSEDEEQYFDDGFPMDDQRIYPS